MKSKTRRLLELAGIVHRSSGRLILEEEEEEDKEDEGGLDDLFGGGDDEGGDDDAEKKDEEGEDTEEGTDKKEEKEEKKEEEIDPVKELSPSEIAKYGDGEIDVEVNDVLQNIYTQAIEKARVKSITSLGYPGKVKSLEIGELKKESRYSLKQLLVEEDIPAEEFDMGFYAGEIARYIKNYQSLLDIEGMIFNKARQMLLNQIGSEAESEFVETLVKVHGIDFTDSQQDPELEGASRPTAVGATPGGGG